MIPKKEIIDSINNCEPLDRTMQQKVKLIIKWADQIDEISELLIQHYNVAMKDEDYHLMEELNEIIDEFESIDSKYIKYR